MWIDEELNDEIRWFPTNRWVRCFGQIPLRFNAAEHEEEFQKLQAERRHALLKPFVHLTFPVVIAITIGMFVMFANPETGTRLQLSSAIIFLLLAALVLTLRLKLTSDGVFVLIASLISVLFIASQTYRQLVVLGEVKCTEDDSSGCGHEFTDSFVILENMGFMAFACSMPGVRCTRCFWMCALVPVVYWFSTVYLPGDFEGDVVRRRNLCGSFGILSLYFFTGRVRLENMERRDYMRQKLLSSHLTKERVLRAKAEHEVERGPFSDHPRPAAAENDRKSEFGAEASVNPSSVIFSNQLGPEDKLHLVESLGQEEGWAIPEDALQLETSGALGEGSFGKVFHGKYWEAGVAIKVSTSAEPLERLAAVNQELRHLRSLSHPNIVAFYGACAITASQGLLLVIEDLSRGKNLKALLRDSPALPDEVRHTMLVGISSALTYMHPDLVHGDLKPSNVMVVEDSTAKLIDFGLSRLAKPNAEPLGGTWRWMAPEVMLPGKAARAPSPAADMFSFGRLAFHVLTGIVPVADFRKDQLMKLARAGTVPELAWPQQRQGSLQDGCCSFCDQCISVDRKGRPKARNVLQQLAAWPAQTSRPALGEVLERFWGEGAKQEQAISGKKDSGDKISL